MKSLLPEKYHYQIYIFALIVLVIGLPLSKFLMSLSQIILACNWLLEGNLKSKTIAFFKNKSALVLSSLLFLHFLGLLHTSDFDYAFSDIRIKAPLFILPLIIATSKPISEKIIDIILQLFIAAVVFGTIVSTLIFSGFIYRPITDIRAVSIFISHIRFALLICVAIFLSAYFIYKKNKLEMKILFVITLIWLILFLFLIESLTGVFALTITSFVIFIYTILKSKNSLFRFISLFGIIVLIAFSYYSGYEIIYQNNKKAEVLDFKKLEKYTSHGNLYQHEINSKLTENGNLVWINYCEKELEESWNKRSKMKYAENDLKGNKMKYTLVRFLTSKGLKKDEDAVNALNQEEITAIEKGVANVNYKKMNSIVGRLNETLWEINLYKNTGDVNGHSLTQRFEYWKTATTIIKENLLVGVGTGDVQKAFDDEYIKTNSKLDADLRFHSHNQYLSITVAFGIIGLLWFLFTLIYPMIKEKMGFDFLYITFFIIVIFSFFTEDTLETQAGVTFFAFFNSFFLFAKRKN